jgi:quercetin dioxygenase-like cupin family protein
MDWPEPYGIEVHEADGLFLKQMFIPKRDTTIPQHAHAYDHLSMLVKGSVGVWKNGVFDQCYKAPKGILIKAGIKHLFLSLTDDTEIWCVHSLGTEKVVKILAEHDLSEYAGKV